MRSEKEGEYESKEFVDFCKQCGIKKHTKTRYTPHQNEVTKIKNQTFMNMARSLLKARNLSKDFWVEAIVVLCTY